MKKTKKGSSMILVIFLTAMIFITGTAMLALVTTDYTARVNQSKRLQNLYSADSGINLAYNVAVKEAELATLCANNRVYSILTSDREYFQNDGVIDNEIYNKLNKLFKNYFIKALLSNNNLDGSIPILSEGNICNSIENLAYREIDEEYIDNFSDEEYQRYIDYISDIVSLNQLERINDPMTTIEEGDIKDANIQAEVVEASYYNGEELGEVGLSTNFEEYDEDFYIVIQITSTFRDEKRVNKDLSNTQKIRTKFTIKAPNYEQSLNAEKVTDIYYMYPFLNALAADGNVNIYTDEVNGIKVAGDMWVGGINKQEYSEEQQYIDNKYMNGVRVASGKLDVKGNIYTDGTVSLCKDSIVNVYNSGDIYGGGDIYSLNLYLGPSANKSENSRNNLVSCDNLITNNDLTMNSTNSYVNIDNYYGISDVEFNGSSIDINNTNSIKKAARTSSSIIINTVDSTNNISIKNAYVNGVSFIDVDSDVKYETGESISVNGNYIAYLDRMPGYGNVQFEHYSSYALLSGDINIKKDYFGEFYNRNKSLITEGGIEIDNLNAIGSYVYKKDGQLVVYNSDNDTSDILELNSIVNDKKEKYAKNVYLMGYNESYDLMDVYNNSELKRTIASGSSSIIKFNESDKVIVSKANILEFTNYDFIYNPNDENVIFIDDEGIVLKDKNGEVLNKIKNNNTNCCRAVIITKGNVFINNNTESLFQYYGSIISGGDINIEGENIAINYYEEDQIDKAALTIKEILNGKSGKDLEKVFTSRYNPQEVITGTSISVDYKIRRGYDANKYMKQGLWKVVNNQSIS